MAMLSGPRRKQKVINLRAKNNEWSNDANKFGQRMLEKMGWSSGKGLGANENGMVEHVVARYKNDEKGLGFEDKNDQWTKHEDDFNALLTNLSNGDNSNKEKLHSGVSLEDKSKKSKARVHYHKFTRGKDLTRYSEKDLANIFGKKSLKNEDKTEEVLKEDIGTTEQVFTEKGSMEDYFKNKLAAMKSKSTISLNYGNVKEDYEADYNFRGFAGSTNADTEFETRDEVSCKEFSFYNTSKENEQLTDDNHEVVSKKIKKKKSKKKQVDLEDQVSHVNNDNDCENTQNQPAENTELEVLEPVKKKKCKKNKQEIEIIEEIVGHAKGKKSKLDKNIAEEIIEEDCYVPKKMKKRKNKDFES